MSSSFVVTGKARPWPVEDFDLLVIGGGKAGKSLGMDLAAGQRVAMVERAWSAAPASTWRASPRRRS